MIQEFTNQAKKHNDSLFIRTYLLLLAAIIFGLTTLMHLFTNASDYILGSIAILAFAIMGFYLLYVGVFASSQKANLVAEKTGNHEILILIIIVAGIVSAGIRKYTSAR